MFTLLLYCRIAYCEHEATYPSTVCWQIDFTHRLKEGSCCVFYLLDMVWFEYLPLKLIKSSLLRVLNNSTAGRQTSWFDGR